MKSAVYTEEIKIVKPSPEYIKKILEFSMFDKIAAEEQRLLNEFIDNKK